jgi:hypothetical protein
MLLSGAWAAQGMWRASPPLCSQPRRRVFHSGYTASSDLTQNTDRIAEHDRIGEKGPSIEITGPWGRFSKRDNSHEGKKAHDGLRVTEVLTKPG